MLARAREESMVRKLVLAFAGLGVASVVAICLLTIPLLRRLPKPSLCPWMGSPRSMTQ